MSNRQASILFILIIILIAISRWLDFRLTDPQRQLNQLEKNLNKVILGQKEVLSQLQTELAESNDPAKINYEQNVSLRVYDNGTLIYWNDQQKLPEYSVLKKTEDQYVINQDQSVYLINREAKRYNENSLIEFFSIIPLYTEYPINNEYLRESWNPIIFESQSWQYDPEKQNINYEGTILTGFSQTNNNDQNKTQLINFLYFIISILLLGFLLLPSSKRWIIIISAVLLIRLLIQLLIGSYPLIPTTWNDPTLYYDSWWLTSISNLLFHQIFLLILIYHTYQYASSHNWPQKISFITNGWKKYAIGIVLLILGIGNFKLFFDLIWSLNNNTLSVFDISKTLKWNDLRLVLIFSLLIQSMIAFFANHIIISCLKDNYPLKFQVFVLSIIGLISFWLIPEFVIINLIIGSLALLATQFKFAFISLNSFRYQTLAYLSFVGVFLSLLIAYANYEYDEKTTAVEKEKFASAILLGNDVLGEFYIQELTNQIKKDPFIRSRFLNQLLAQQNIKIRIGTQIPIYLDKYEWEIHTYNAEGAPYGLTETTDLDYWIHNFAIPAYETGYDGIYFLDNQSGRNKYISIIPIDFYDRHIGNIVIEFTQKKFTDKTVFPALLVEKNPFAPEDEYDYAIYQENELIFSRGDFEFEMNLDESSLNTILKYRKGKEINASHFLGKRFKDGRILIIQSPVYPWISIISNAAFYIILYLILFSASYSIYRLIVPNKMFSLSNKIQFYIGASFLIPMLLVTVSLLQILNNLYLTELTDKYEEQARSMSENISRSTADFISNTINRDQYYYELQNASNYSQNDIIIYDSKGRVLGSNRQEVFNLGLIGDRINPSALNALHSDKGQIVVLDEQIGLLAFKNVYTVLYDIRTGKNLGILSIPFFDFQQELDRQQVLVFQYLIILICAVLIITLIVSQINLRKIIEPIKTIANHLNSTTYLETNTPIHTYQSNDEIGQLVAEYNAMVSKLESSKKELAAIEKETAWKEIAKQVAHEIKNPLTPMRLKIQQLQRHFDINSKQYATLDSLFVQVDTLAMIADSFSEFAKMPAPQNEELNLSKVIQHAAALFQSDDVIIETDIVPDMIIWADEKLLGQIFNNLILNAIQSYSEKAKYVKIQLKKGVQKATVAITDHGKGIPEELKEKIFKPYFSTKETGSGIGLALAKKGIEQANGSIWFETEEGKGTTFFISFPLA